MATGPGGEVRAPHDPVVGRDRERQQFVRLLTGGRPSVVLHGPAGVGKTRLALEFCAEAQALGHPMRFVAGRGTMTDLPLAPFASLLGMASVDATGASLLVEARTAIEQLGASRPLVLGVDDAHLLDAASATLVHQLVTGARVLAVITVRDGEWVPPPIVELWHSGLAERWEVRALADRDAVTMARSLLGDADGGALAERIARLSGGNPLYLAALAGAARERPGDVDGFVGARSLVEFVEGELRSLTPDQRDALAVVALAEPVGLWMLDRLLEPAALIDLERHGWIILGHDGRREEVRLRHPLFGEVLRRSLSRMLARSVYSELARLVEQVGARRRGDRLRGAFWSLEGGQPLSPAALAAASAEAYRAGDLVLAGRFAEAVWDSDDSEARFEAGLLLRAARVPRVTADPALFGAELAQAARTPRDRAILAIRDADDDGIVRHDPAAAVGRLWRARGNLAERSLERQLDGQRALWMVLGGDHAGARPLIDELLAIDDDDPMEYAAASLAALMTATGAPQAGADELVAWVESDPGAMRRVEPYRGLTRLASMSSISRWFIQRGDGIRAERWARAVMEDAAASAQLSWRPLTELAYVLSWRADTTAAAALARSAAERQRLAGAVLLERWSHIVECMTLCYGGDLDGARRAAAAVDAIGPTTVPVHATDEWYARSLLAEVEGDLARSLHIAEQGLALAVATGDVYGQVLGWESVAWLSPTEAAAEGLEALARRHGGLAELSAPYARGRSENSAVQVARAAELSFDRGINSFAVSHATQAALMAATTDARLAARLHRRAGEMGVALDIGGPYRVEVPVEPLSRREREIAELAAQGLASRDIGERLFLSTRTVDNHLARIYDKLGIDGREELAGVIGSMP